MRTKKQRKGFSFVWFIGVCLISEEMRDNLFSNRIKEPLDIVDAIKKNVMEVGFESVG